MGKSLLSCTAILENLGGGVIIDPFDPEQLKTCSYDVRLGEQYFRRCDPTESGDVVFNPYDPEVVARHYRLCEAQSASSIPMYGSAGWRNIAPDDLVILLSPGEMILGHTVEFVGGTKDPQTGRCFTAEMKARSSVGRVGLEVCRCAGWGDVGYVNRWTMEVVCTSPVPVVMVVGTRLAQMKFYEVDQVDDCELYGADASRDHYQHAVDLAAIKAAWRPEMLLPRLTKT